MYGDDAQRSRAIALVNALLGNWNHQGAFFKPAKVHSTIPISGISSMDYERVDNPAKNIHGW